ncbi:flagellar biosynthesis anti-sigma factor FlgM [Oceanimonas sp. CHS3-5]|uniref:flagellar biosynthesis anti-sigma factor FlgM n=1 Tax=Oceanimonas sp. CHS3-5 TaxID=3068186 RepID=UPI00273E4286|nr:flagellar biosynthesis anti-sigma factor FlgM [Oceanimonas sp. CHS3-5]MDP5292299.1 flagellar biosynthesis anti-sigma factor FlgM [Oceanimonas sp. CHS3-5]
MAIDKLPPGLHNSPSVSGNKYPQKSDTAEARSDNRPQAASGRDEVTLTPEAKQLNRMQQSLQAGAGTDNSTRLDAIKKAVNEGSYKIDADRLAGNIINLEQDIESLY